MRRFAAVVIASAALGATARAQAQTGRAIGPPAVEAVAAVTTSSDAPGDPFLFFDVAATVPLGSRFGAVVRPYAHRLAGGEWAAEMYQLQLRYQSATRIPVRVDAGIITSPLGLGTLELKPDVNPTIKNPFYYVVPLPAFDARRDGLQLMSGGYPLGVMVSASGEKWDARAGLTDSTPARERNVFESGRPPAMRQLAAGAGISPITGLRFGAAIAQGAYRRAEHDPTGQIAETKDAMVLNVEGEYSFGHSRFSGEWIRNRFESDAAPAVARGYFVQAVQTLSPRLFASVRVAGTSAPARVAAVRQQRTMRTAEIVAGYRLNKDLTVRGGYYGMRRYTAVQWDHMALASVVWARRWF